MNKALDEDDLALIHALQVAPRVTWREAAPILGASPATLAARWGRLRSQRLAWVTAYPAALPGVALGDVTVALVEIDCTPGARPSVVRHLCQDSRAVTVEESARGRDLLLTVLVPDLQALTRFVLDDLPAVDGIAAQRTYLATEVHFDGSRWRLDALDGRQLSALRAAVGATAAVPDGPVPSPPPNAWPLIEALASDGRASAADLARRTGRKPATVRRQLSRLLGSQRLTVRCEVAQVQSRWPISCSWLARVPVHEHDRTVQALSTLPELRLCASTTGETNMMMTVWVRSLRDLLRLERLLAQKLPWLHLVDTAVTLRTAKRMGWLLDAQGRCTGEVVPSTALRGIG